MCVLICYLNTVYENFYEALKFISVFCAGTNHGGGGGKGNICARIPSYSRIRAQIFPLYIYIYINIWFPSVARMNTENEKHSLLLLLSCAAWKIIYVYIYIWTCFFNVPKSHSQKNEILNTWQTGM